MYVTFQCFSFISKSHVHVFCARNYYGVHNLCIEAPHKNVHPAFDLFST